MHKILKVSVGSCVQITNKRQSKAIKMVGVEAAG